MAKEILNEDLTIVSEALDKGEISSEEITRLCLAQVAELDGKIGAMLWVNEDLAILEAKASDQRRAKNQSLGPLDGIPVTLKDMILCEGLPATAASKILQGYFPPYEAT
ncbi:MAG TPA: amidase family protein, partial [Myxococcota bacterium]|nr:amidase family protein [Myxococcota bacterium]